MRQVPILFLSVTSILGGGSEVVYTLVKSIHELKKNGIEYKAIVACPADGEYFQLMKNLGIEVYDLPLRKLKLSNFYEIRKICKRHSIQLIHTHGKGAGLFGRIVSFLSRITSVHSFHGYDCDRMRPIHRGMYIAYESFFSFFTDAYIFVSDSEKDKFDASHSLVSNAQKNVVFNGIDPSRLNISRPRREKFGLLEDDILIVTMARVTEQKGLEYLIDALFELKKSFDQDDVIKIIIAGDDIKEESTYVHEKGYREKILKKIDECGLTDSIILRKKSSDVLSLVSVCDFYLSSSLWEGFSLALVEAMLLKLPIVATDVTGNRDAIVHGVTGLLVPPKDSSRIAGALIELINDPDYSESLANNACQSAKKLFSYDAMVDKTVDVYQSIIE